MKRKENLIGVIGLGYVGSEVAKLASSLGYEVATFDKDQTVRTTFLETTDDHIILAESSESLAKEATILLIAVPTPLNSSYSVNLDSLEAAVTDVANGVSENRNKPIVIIESTIPPGTIRNVVKPIFEDRDLEIGVDVQLAHAPERIDPANDEWPLSSLPRVVGALTDDGLQRATRFYSALIDADVHPVNSPEIAEASKIIENAFRDVNIAFVNEIALSLDKLDVDAIAALDAAATKPFGFMKFEPGAGVGGHCIPVDPYLLIDQAERSGFDHRFLKLAREINDYMPEHVVQETVRALNDERILPNGADVLLLGKSFKPNVPDTRNSPYFEIRSGLEEFGCNVELYDPKHSEASTVDTPFAPVDAVVLVTAHDEFRALTLEQFAERGLPIMVDGRNVFESDHEVDIQYVGIGK